MVNISGSNFYSKILANNIKNYLSFTNELVSITISKSDFEVANPLTIDPNYAKFTLLL